MDYDMDCDMDSEMESDMDSDMDCDIYCDKVCDMVIQTNCILYRKTLYLFIYLKCEVIVDCFLFFNISQPKTALFRLFFWVNF